MKHLPVLRGQILLDRACFSPGPVDGRLSENFAKAIRASPVKGFPSDGKLLRRPWDRLSVRYSASAIRTHLRAFYSDISRPSTDPRRLEQKGSSVVLQPS